MSNVNTKITNVHKNETNLGDDITLTMNNINPQTNDLSKNETNLGGYVPLTEINNLSKNETNLGGDNALSVNNLTIIYKNGNIALENLSFSLPQGTMCALLGINGGGKSTLFKSIMGIIQPTKGSILLNSRSIEKSLSDNLIAYVPQSEEIDWNFPILVKDVVMMGRYGKLGLLKIPTSKDKDVVHQALERVGMLEYKNRQIGELSGGQRKRVFIARALAQEAKIMLLDEPFTGIDITTEKVIIDLLKEIKNQCHLILISTHNICCVSKFCDQVVLINKTLLALGSIENQIIKDHLNKAFGQKFVL